MLGKSNLFELSTNARHVTFRASILTQVRLTFKLTLVCDLHVILSLWGFVCQEKRYLMKFTDTGLL